MNQTQVVVHLGKTYFKPQGQITLWLQGQIGIVQQIKLKTSVIPLFHVIFTGQSISEIILFIKGDLQGQKVYFKVK